MLEPRNEWRMVLEATAALTTALELDDLLHTVLRLAAEVAGAEGSSVILLDEAGGELVIAAASGAHADEVQGRRFPADGGIAGAVLAAGSPRTVTDAQEHRAHLQDIDHATGHLTRSLMAAPLIVGGHRLGVVEVVNRIGGGSFTDSDLDRFGVFANLIAISLRNAKLYGLLRRENEGLRRTLDDRADRFIAESPAMRKVTALADRAAAGASTVLLLGETGSGKEQVAKRIHRLSHRSDRPFVALNCGAIPESLVESELFGHERGAFTGADRRRLGRFELADTGTLFLDEVGELSPHAQVRLLRVLQEREFERLGGTSSVRIDVRLIAATARDLDAEVRQGLFRQDLFFRINVVPIVLPPLRDRREDIGPLVELFLARCARDLGRPPRQVRSEAVDRLCRHDWPGNVRELENLVERLMVLGDDTPIGAAEVAELLPDGDGSPRPVGGRGDQSDPPSLWDIERGLLVRALADNGGNQSAAARQLGVSRSQLRTRMNRYGLL